MLHECINLEITTDGKLCNLICLYRSPSQNMEEFETFLKNAELNLDLFLLNFFVFFVESLTRIHI